MRALGVTTARLNCLYFSILPRTSGQYPPAPPLV